MDKQSAVMLLDQYMQRADAVDLDERQQQRVIRKLQWLNSADVNTVVKIAEEENSMYRGNAPQSQQNPTQKGTQTKKEINEIISYFLSEKYFERMAPQAVPLCNEDGSVRSMINTKAFFQAVHEQTTAGIGKQRVGHDILGGIVIKLDQDKLLEHYAQTVERVVEVEKPVPLTRRQEAKQNFALDKAMNRDSDSPIKGIGVPEAKKPAATEAELVAQASHDLQENETMGSVRSVIAGHRNSASHSATRYEKEILTNLMTDGIRKNLPAETILANVKAKQNAMAKYGPQQALKELHPELFTGQPKAAY